MHGGAKTLISKSFHPYGLATFTCWCLSLFFFDESLAKLFFHVLGRLERDATTISTTREWTV